MTLENIGGGRVASLHVHPDVARSALIDVDEFNLVAEKGIREDKRYFGRTRQDGSPSKRQVTLIEREMIRDHGTALGAEFSPGDVRSNIETEGVDLIKLIGSEVTIGEVVLRFVEPRTPCHQMDALAQGLRELMENGRQGVIAIVVVGGRIRPGDEVRATSSPSGPESARRGMS